MKYYNASLYGENDRLTKNNIIEVEDGHVVSITNGCKIDCFCVFAELL